MGGEAMNYKTVCRLERVTDKIEETLFVIGAIPLGILYIPVYIMLLLRDFYKKKRQERIIAKWAGTHEDIGKLPYDVKIDMLEAGKINLSNYPHDRKNYLHCRDKDLYPFFRKRKLVLDFMEIAYVENKYCERMHHFFEEHAEWIKDFEHWHGFRIVFIDYEEMKEGMFFPQDFDNFMNHGFLWNEYTSSCDPEYGLGCADHIYVDIELTSDDDIKKQMQLFMWHVYNTFQWRII